jgi:parallel beta-helix repeat protein
MHMTSRVSRLKALVGAGALAAGCCGLAGLAAPAGAQSSTLYVSTSGTDSATCGAQASPCATVDQAITNAAAGDMISVGPGEYHQQVVVTKPVTLQSHFATIDASGLSTGSGQTMDAAGIEVLGSASGSKVAGFTVTGAYGEGILVLGASHVTVQDNTVRGNDLGTPSTTSYLECQPQGRVPGDCGEGIHLMSSTDSMVIGNRVEDNSGGILVTDEIGPSTGNDIAWNYVAGNLWDCGITVASHSTTAVDTSGQLAPTKGGDYGNRITNNRVIANGVLGDGAGILFAAAASGGASYDNFVGGNTIMGNGMSGVTIHAHAPRQDVSGNTIVWNTIGTNNVSGDPDAKDFATTGVLVFSAVPTVTVSVTMAHNAISGNAKAIWTTSNVVVKA